MPSSCTSRWCADLLPAFGLALLAAALPARAGTYFVSPANYQGIVASAQPGDTVNFAAGNYPLLGLTGLNGAGGARIVLQGPASGQRAVITINPNSPDCCNIVQLGNTSYVTLRNFTVDSALVPFVDGLKANGNTHDIEVIDCLFLGQGSHQQTVAISTKATAWNWVIRGNSIVGAGTGLYLGNSDGSAPFINGVIENNSIADTIGYNAQVKFQVPYAQPAGLDAGPHRTIIRHNVFVKNRSQLSFPPANVDGARPNLLVGGFPVSGYGTDDSYEIYGNFFYQNLDGEPLLQASGRVAVHDNLFVGGSFRAMSFVNHDLPLRRAYAYHNTVYGPPNAITVNGGPLEDSRVSGNLVFSTATGIVAPVAMDNIADTVANAPNYVNSPSFTPDSLDFFPKAGMARGAPLDMTPYSGNVQYNLDFNGDPKGALDFRGAYAGEGANPGWKAILQKKSFPPSGDLDGDGIPNGVEIGEGSSTFAKDNDVFANARFFGMQQYRDFLGREGDAGGITFYTNAINGGTSREQVIENFFNSPEFGGIVAPVTRLYFAFFNRIPDYPGLQFQVNAYHTGTPLTVIANNFSLSPEFVATYGSLDNSQYVVLLYQNVLGRTPVQAEIDFHVNRLNTGSTRGEVMVGFSESPEYQTLKFNAVYVTNMYVGMLRRAPEQGGYDFWVSYMAGGNSGQALIAGFLNSPEYRNRFLP